MTVKTDRCAAETLAVYRQLGPWRMRRLLSLRFALLSLAAAAGLAAALPRYKWWLKVYEYNANKRKLFELMPRVSGSSVIVDIGAGAGVFTRRLRDELAATSPTLIALDLSHHDLRSARDCSLPVCADLERGHLPFLDDSVDVILCDQVVEHLYHPERAIEEMGRVLKPNGWLLLSTPNLGSWHNLVALGLGKHPPALSIEAGHIRAFTKATIRQIFEGAGFRVSQVTGSGYTPLPPPFSTALASADVPHSLYFCVAAQKQAAPPRLLLGGRDGRAAVEAAQQQVLAQQEGRPSPVESAVGGNGDD